MKMPATTSRLTAAKCLLLLACITTLISCHKEDDPPLTFVDNTIGHVFVANEDGQSISVIDAKTQTHITDIDVSDPLVSMVMVHNVQAAPNGQTIWATGMGMVPGDQEQLIVIDPNTNQVIHRVYVGEDLHLAHVVLDSDCSHAFVTAYEGDKIYQISTATYTVTDSFALDTAGGPHGMRYYDHKLYIANMDGHSLTIIDLNTRNITDIPLGGIAVQAAISPNGKYVFCSLFDTREVARYTISTGQLSKFSLPAGSQGPIQMYPTPDNKYVYIADQGALLGRPASNKVYRMDMETGAILSTTTVGSQAHGVVVSNDGKFVYVTNVMDNTVSVIQCSDNAVVATIPVGAAPNGIAYWYSSGGMP